MELECEAISKTWWKSLLPANRLRFYEENRSFDISVRLPEEKQEFG